MAEVKTGYMHKCGKTVKSWKKRWFVLKPNGYLYYSEGPGKGEKGKIDVVDASRVAPWQEVGTAEKKLPSGLSGANSFAIVSSDRTYTCVCEEDDECRSWIMAIEKLRVGNDEQQYPAPTYTKSENIEQPSKEVMPSYQAPPPQYNQQEAATPPAIPPSHSLPPQNMAPPPQPGRPLSQSMPGMPDPTQYGGSMPITHSLNPAAGPGFQGSYPVGQFQQAPPRPMMAPPRPVMAPPRPMAPQAYQQQMPPNYYGPPRQPPPRPQYYQQPPPQRPVQYYQGPPRPAYGSYAQRPPPPRVYYQQPPPPQRPKTIVTVITVPQKRVIYR